MILDLEDGTHPSRATPRARRSATPLLVCEPQSKTVAVRINGDLLTAVTDLRAAVRPGLDLLVLPKVEHARDIQLLSSAVEALEGEAGVESGHVRFLLQIESAAALPRLHDIAAAHPRVMGMMLGSEDFSLDCGCLPMPDALLVPSLMVLHAARAARIQPIGFVGSIAGLGSTEDFKVMVERARALGFRGAVVVHPKFLTAINDCFTPSAEQIADARRIVQAFDSWQTPRDWVRSASKGSWSTNPFIGARSICWPKRVRPPAMSPLDGSDRIPPSLKDAYLLEVVRHLLVAAGTYGGPLTRPRAIPRSINAATCWRRFLFRLEARWRWSLPLESIMSTLAASEVTKRDTILTGDRPTGPLHLGHLCRQLAQLASPVRARCRQFVMLADAQALTDNMDDTGKVRRNVVEVALDYLAVGIDPDDSTICVQSQFPNWPN